MRISTAAVGWTLAWLLTAGASAQPIAGPPRSLTRLPAVDKPPVQPLREMIDPSRACVEVQTPLQYALPDANPGTRLVAMPLIPELALSAPPAPVMNPSPVQRVSYLTPATAAAAFAPTPEVGWASLQEASKGTGPISAPVVPTPSPYTIDPRAAATQSGRPQGASDLEQFYFPLERQRAMSGVLDNALPTLSAGVVAPTGGGFYEQRLETGWGISAGLRRPWFGGSERRGAWFGEIAGAFAQNGGNGTTQLTPGALLDLTGGVAFVAGLSDAFATELRDLRRGTVNLGLGRYFTPRWGSTPGRSWQFSSHAGLQFGHAHAVYRRTNSATLDALIASRIAGGSDPTQIAVFSGIDDSDTFFGLYAGGGLFVNWYDVSTHFGRWRQVSLGVELDYLSQNIDLDNFSGNAGPLTTLAPMAVFSVGY